MYPELTDFIYDSNKMLEMGLDAIGLAQSGFDTVLDRVMFNFIWKYFRNGIQLAEEKGKQKGIRFKSDTIIS